jgi:hypothetical protein
MANEIRNLVRDVVAAPLGDIIASVGDGVAAAQAALDEGSLEKTLEIYAAEGDAGTKMVRDIGYRPTFYTLPETIGEVNIAMSLGNSTKGKTSAPITKTKDLRNKRTPTRMTRSQMYATPVDGGYASKYGFNATVATKLTFKIVPVPAIEGVDELRGVPDLKGLNGHDALEKAEEFDLDIVFVDKKGVEVAEPKLTLLVKSQIPSGGTVVRVGDNINVVL